jgi:hypothetical protein
MGNMTSRSMISRRAAAIGTICFALSMAAAAAPGRQAAQNRKERPTIELRVSPPVGVAPLRVVATAELKGGAEDFADFYCPKVEWEWADGTTSQVADDCQPYEAGKSEIRRRYSQQHTFKDAGAYRIIFNLKQGTKTVGASTIRLEVHGY